MKKVLAFCLIGILMITLAGCGAKGDATKAFDTMMTALKTGEKDQIAPYYDFGAAGENMVAGNKDKLEQTILKTLHKMEYKVVSSERVDNNKVKLKLDVTTLDFSTVMDRFAEKLMVLVSSEDYQSRIGSMSREENQALIAENLMEVLNQEDIRTVQQTLEVGMEKESGNWKLGEGNEEFFHAIFANLIQVVTTLV